MSEGLLLHQIAIQDPFEKSAAVDAIVFQP
jgi:hypothetical protein